MKNVAVLPPIKSQLRAALLNVAAYKEIPTMQLIKAAGVLPGGSKVRIEDRLTAIVLLLGTGSVDVG
jgi:hypothetical protein